MLGALITTATVGALGILWGSKHPDKPFEKLADAAKDQIDKLKNKKPKKDKNEKDD